MKVELANFNSKSEKTNSAGAPQKSWENTLRIGIEVLAHGYPLYIQTIVLATPTTLEGNRHRNTPRWAIDSTNFAAFKERESNSTS